MVVVKNPRACSAAEIDRFCTLVTGGGEVAADGLRSRVAQAHVLVFLCLPTAIVGVAAIKVPDPDYRKNVFIKAGAVRPEQFALELGWLVIDRSHQDQGWSERLIRAGLATANGGVFATAAASNDKVRHINRKVGLIASGHAYVGITGRDMQLFLRAI